MNIMIKMLSDREMSKINGDGLIWDVLIGCKDLDKSLDDMTRRFMNGWNSYK